MKDWHYKMYCRSKGKTYVTDDWDALLKKAHCWKSHGWTISHAFVMCGNEAVKDITREMMSQ